MTTFLAIYRGETIASARLLAVSCDRDLVARAAAEILDQIPEEVEGDAIMYALDHGRHRALRLIVSETKDSDRGK